MSYTVSRFVLFFILFGASAQIGLKPPHYKVYKSHRHTHTQQDFSEQVISLSQMLQLIQPTQEENIHALSGL